MRGLGPSTVLAALLVGAPSLAKPATCSNATLKGTYLYHHTGILEGQPYAESGREVYDGGGGIVLTFRGSDGVTGTVKASYRVNADCTAKASYPDGQAAESFVSPDGSRFTYTITRARGNKINVLAGTEVRVAP
jgi:hypothetical protein